MRSDSVHHDHALFRQVLQAMSHPGTSWQLADPGSITGENISLVLMLGCLMDNEVTFTIIGDDTQGLSAALSLHTGSVRGEIGEADFVIALRGTSDGQLSLIKRGTPEYPDMGATLIYLIDTIAEEGGTTELTGPGIKGTVTPLFEGLAAAELSGLREANAEFPLGVDVIVLDNYGRITCIPRSTRIGGC